MTPTNDGQRVAVYTEQALTVFELTEGRREWTATLPTSPRAAHVVWHPDGTRVIVANAYVDALTSSSQLELRLLGNGTAWRTNVTSTQSLPRFSPNGELLYVAGALFRFTQGELQRDFDVAWVAPHFDRAVLPDGQLIALPTRAPLATLSGNVRAWSLDGRWLIEDANSDWVTARDAATGRIVSRLNKSATWPSGAHESHLLAFIDQGNAVLVQREPTLDEPGQTDTPWRWSLAQSRFEPLAPAARLAIDRVRFDDVDTLRVGSALESSAERSYQADIDLSDFRLARFEQPKPGSPRGVWSIPYFTHGETLSGWREVDCAPGSRHESSGAVPRLAATCGHRVRIWEHAKDVMPVLETPKLDGVNPFSGSDQLAWNPSGTMLAVAALDRVHLICVEPASRMELVLTRPHGAANVELIAIAPSSEVDGTKAGLELVRYEALHGPSLDLTQATRTYGTQLQRRGLVHDFVANCRH